MICILNSLLKIFVRGLRLNQLHSVVQQCIADMKGIIPNQLEIMDNGILTVPFYECVNNVCKENGVEISSFTFMLEA